MNFQEVWHSTKLDNASRITRTKKLQRRSHNPDMCARTLSTLQAVYTVLQLLKHPSTRLAMDDSSVTLVLARRHFEAIQQNQIEVLSTSVSRSASQS